MTWCHDTGDTGGVVCPNVVGLIWSVLKASAVDFFRIDLVFTFMIPSFTRERADLFFSLLKQVRCNWAVICIC